MEALHPADFVIVPSPGRARELTVESFAFPAHRRCSCNGLNLLLTGVEILELAQALGPVRTPGRTATALTGSGNFGKLAVGGDDAGDRAVV